MGQSKNTPITSDALVSNGLTYTVNMLRYNLLIKFIATGFYSGMARFAPGTFGSIAFFILYLLAAYLCPAIIDIFPFTIITIFILLAGIFVCNETLRLKIFSDSKDPKQVVIDEFAGMSFALLGISFSVLHAFIALVLFRIFDISKLWPANKLESLPKGLGIMMDDVAAGIYANLLLRIIIIYSM